MMSARQIISPRAMLSAYELERQAGRLAAIERTRTAARGIIADLERSFGIAGAFAATAHAITMMDVLDKMERKALSGGLA